MRAGPPRGVWREGGGRGEGKIEVTSKVLAAVMGRVAHPFAESTHLLIDAWLPRSRSTPNSSPPDRPQRKRAWVERSIVKTFVLPEYTSKCHGCPGELASSSCAQAGLA